MDPAAAAADARSTFIKRWTRSKRLRKSLMFRRDGTGIGGPAGCRRLLTTSSRSGGGWAVDARDNVSTSNAEARKTGVKLHQRH